MMYNYCFCVKHFDFIEMFGDVVNSNIFMRIFWHSTVHLDLKDLLELKEFKYLERIELKELKDLVQSSNSCFAPRWRHGIMQYGSHDASGPSNRSRAKDCTKAQSSVECEQRAAAAYTRHHHPHLISPAAFRQAQNRNMLTTALYPNWWAPLPHTKCWKPSTSSRIAGTRWATGGENPRDFVGVTVTAN
jgi:hypothetical protein